MAIALLVGLLFFVIGIAVLIGGVVSILKTRSRIINSSSAEGVVTGFSTEMGQGGHLHYPLVEFKIDSGQTIDFRSSVGTSRTGYVVGQPVKVLYAAGNPQEAEIDTMTSLWLLPGCMLA